MGGSGRAGQGPKQPPPPLRSLSNGPRRGLGVNEWALGLRRFWHVAAPARTTPQLATPSDAPSTSGTCLAGPATGHSWRLVGLLLLRNVVCGALSQCHEVGVCQPATGECTHPPKPDGTSCNDHSTKTFLDQCIAGECRGESFFCFTEPCLNGGTCIPTKEICECTPGWTGQTCNEVRVDPCDPNPCLHAGMLVLFPWECCRRRFCCFWYQRVGVSDQYEFFIGQG